MIYFQVYNHLRGKARSARAFGKSGPVGWTARRKRNSGPQRQKLGPVPILPRFALKLDFKHIGSEARSNAALGGPAQRCAQRYFDPQKEERARKRQ